MTLFADVYEVLAPPTAPPAAWEPTVAVVDRGLGLRVVDGQRAEKGLLKLLGFQVRRFKPIRANYTVYVFGAPGGSPRARWRHNNRVNPEGCPMHTHRYQPIGR